MAAVPVCGNMPCNAGPMRTVWRSQWPTILPEHRNGIPWEHCLFGPISINWAGELLDSLDKMLGLIRGTRTETRLKVIVSR